MRRGWFMAMAAMVYGAVMAIPVERQGSVVTIRPAEGQARVVQLQVVGDRIVRVRATSDAALPAKPKSLIVTGQPDGKAAFDVTETDTTVCVHAREVRAVVTKQTGRIAFYDAKGRLLARESAEGKAFTPYRVPDREIGVDASRVAEQQRRGLSWRMSFDGSDGESFYGLGQHQSEELDMRGRNEELFQYNTKVSVPFVVSSRRYGILWDSYSYGRFGQPDDYLQLHRAFRLYDKQGREGHLTGTYTERGGRQLVRDEDSLYYEYDMPAASELCRQNDRGGIRNLPEGFNLNGATVVYEGFLEAPSEAAGEDLPYDFILYYAGYVKVYIGGELVVPERWRTAWNPNSYKFTARLPKGRRTQLRIEWKPDGGVSYCGLRVARPRPAGERQRLSVWNEMAQDMDYYFIAGRTMDEVIGGYRTLTGKAPVFPKWVLGFWQSRERYKTQQELVGTLAEFRQRRIPIDNIVQDWNYWPEDQWGSHEFEASRYPDPQQMVDSIHALHGRLMISVWPKFYCNTEHYRQLDERGWMYHQAVTDDIHDWVGRGYVGSFYDAYSEGARKLFWQQMAAKLFPIGWAYLDAWWMDASEPNVRDCTPMWYRKALCGPTALGTATEYFNAYSLLNADAIYHGQRSVRPNQRVFLLTRSGFAGLQRYSTATWSGDIGTRWEDMRAQMTAGMNYSLSGMPFWGMDVGGFCVENRYVEAQKQYQKTGVENDDLREWRELQARWAQFGAFVPLFRVHGQWPYREIWNLAGERRGHGAAEDAAQSPLYRSFLYYDELRYRLMPYLYSMAGWVHLYDYTMMRALVMDFTDDREARDVRDQWMFGPSLMACPVAEYKARNRSVYFPEGRAWYDLYTGAQVVDGKWQNRRLVVDAPYERMPVYVPEGSIIPFGPAMQWCDEKPASLITLYVYGGRDADFVLYEDEGTNYDYERGKYSTIAIHYDEAVRTVTFGRRSGSFDGMLKKRQFNVVLITKDAPRPLDLEHPEGVTVAYDGRERCIPLSSSCSH
ncbi:MAG: DUF5110 domain-containing protein [Prevotella sp.]|nr:DUF5110 domain-containing protein [Prevotella sp.]